ncbi:serine protease snake-like [Chironomus tepperi]|uniref:serine protease snake-like n=1 Tax=Chironomus tepperi TaxID=113505 RepID=UPI00391FBFFE
MDRNNDRSVKISLVLPCNRAQKTVCCPISQFKTNIEKKCKYTNTWTTKSCQKAQPIVLGATLAEPNEFPHSALLGYVRKGINLIKWDCLGSLISPNFVLAAAQCLYPPDNSTLKLIKLGGNNRKTKEPGSKIIKIEHLIQHPDYNSQTFNNDIGLIKLKISVVFSQSISPICMPSKNIHSNRTTALIFGKLDSDPMKAERLLKVGLEKFNIRRCQRELGNNPRINGSTMICYGHQRINSNSYQAALGKEQLLLF